MAFFVVQRDADSGLSIPLPDSYPTREAAIAALSSATGSGSLTLTGEVFIADLGAAVPVLLMAVPAGPVAVEPAEATATAPMQLAEEAQPLEDEPEAPRALADAATLDDQDAEDVYAGASILGDELSLAAALKRAASSLEDEGIVAPASIESAPEDDAEPGDSVEWPWANVEAYAPETENEPETEAGPLMASESQTEPEKPEPPVTEIGESDASLESSDAIADEPAEEEPLLEEHSYEAPVEETALEQEAEVFTEETEAPAADDPEPIAVEATDVDSSGDYAEESPYLEAPAAEVLEPLSIAGITDDVTDGEQTLTEPDVIAEEPPIITSAPLDGEEAYVPRPVILGDYADVVSPGSVGQPEAAFAADVLPATVIEEVAEVPGYETKGDVHFEEYTCQDCVYANTCPKVGEATPASCGSFQWRAE